MDTRKIAKEYRLASWAQMARERAESGQNVRTYCRDKGIHENTYYHWQRKLREAAYLEMAPAEGGGPETALAPSGWSAVTDIKPAEQGASVSQELPVEIGNCRVVVSTDTDAGLLAMVCKVLVALC